MIPATAVLSIGAFLAAFYLAGVVPAASAALATIRRAARVIGDPRADDLVKEQQARSAALNLLTAFVSITLRTLIALLGAMVPVWLAGLLGLAQTSDVLAFMETWEVIVGASAALILVYCVVRWVRK